MGQTVRGAFSGCWVMWEGPADWRWCPPSAGEPRLYKMADHEPGNSQDVGSVALRPLISSRKANQAKTPSSAVILSTPGPAQPWNLSPPLPASPGSASQVTASLPAPLRHPECPPDPPPPPHCSYPPIHAPPWSPDLRKLGFYSLILLLKYFRGSM